MKDLCTFLCIYSIPKIFHFPPLQTLNKGYELWRSRTYPRDTTPACEPQMEQFQWVFSLGDTYWHIYIYLKDLIKSNTKHIWNQSYVTNSMLVQICWSLENCLFCTQKEIVYSTIQSLDLNFYYTHNCEYYIYEY